MNNLNRPPRTLTGIILAGGKSLRMGADKAFLEVEGTPIIRRIYTLFQKLFREVIIVTNQERLFRDFDARVCGDLIPDGGAAGGLFSGLFFSSFHYSFTVACDMPYLKEPVIQYLISRIEGYDAVVPKSKDGLQPLHAIYSRNCLEPLREIIAMGNRRVVDFYPMVRVKVIEEDEFSRLDPMGQSFINVNTPSELLSLKKRP